MLCLVHHAVVCVNVHSVAHVVHVSRNRSRGTLVKSAAMQRLLFVTVREEPDAGANFHSFRVRRQGELQYGVIEVDQGTDPDKALKRFAALRLALYCCNNS